MLFNSNFFLYAFLPALLICYYLCNKLVVREKIHVLNGILLVFSVVFYICTGGMFIFLLLAVIFLNYSLGLLIDALKKRQLENITKIALIGAISSNIGLLLYYKYAGFLAENYVNLIRIFDKSYVGPVIEVALPVGISFFIFQAMSYVIDVYTDAVPVQKNIFRFALYIVLFPQLIAGPIVRYKTVCDEILDRKITTTDAFEGGCRFVLGLGKKVLIADVLGEAVDSVYALPSNQLTTILAWGAAFLYTLQIYYDFSGYSDMAIGLGRLFGFHFDENFVQPYTAENVNDFWKRWHISLSSFLKDYLYIPLGGNRNGARRTYINLILVFLVCGLWHGASWTFVIWGVYHGIFQIIERVLRNKYKFQMKSWWGRVISFIIVMMGWILFRAESLSKALEIYRALLGKISISGFQYYSTSFYFTPRIIIIGMLAFVLAFMPFKKVRAWILEHDKMRSVLAICVLIMSMAYMSDASFTPFIYFQF